MTAILAFSGGDMAAIKSVQFVSGQIVVPNPTATITITAVDTANTILLVTLESGGTFGVTDAAQCLYTITLTNSTTITLERSGVILGFAGPVVRIQVIEYYPRVIKSIQYVQRANNGTVTVSDIGSKADVIPYGVLCTDVTGSVIYNPSWVINSTTEVEVKSPVASAAYTFRAAVVDWF